MAEEKLKSIRRFGPRYGRTPKHRFGKIEEAQRKYHKCAYCSKMGVKRIAMGIWHCEKCGVKFTGRAYLPGKKRAVKDIGEVAYEDDTTGFDEVSSSEEVEEEKEAPEESEAQEQ